MCTVTCLSNHFWLWKSNPGLAHRFDLTQIMFLFFCNLFLWLIFFPYQFPTSFIILSFLSTQSSKMDCVWIRCFPRENTELMTGLYRQSRNAASFSKALVNNIAASTLVTYQIQRSVLQWVHCTLHSLSDSPLSLGDTDDKSDAARLIFGGRSQSQWTPGSRPSKISNADCLFLLSLIVTTPPTPDPQVVAFLLVVFTRSPSASHSSSSLATRQMRDR